MPVAENLTDFAREDGTVPSIYNGGGVALMRNAGRSWQHIWDTKSSRCPQAFYDESEYLESCASIMISGHGEIMLNWAIMHVGEKTRWHRQWP